MQRKKLHKVIGIGSLKHSKHMSCKNILKNCHHCKLHSALLSRNFQKHQQIFQFKTRCPNVNWPH